jgi:hypothetical protein
MPLLNSGFEDAGPNPGDAAEWTLVTFVATERIAGFGPVPYRAWEDFERWSELKIAFGAGDLAIAFFDPLAEGFEDFEDAWDNDHYLTELPGGQVAVCPFGGSAVEDLESGWDNDAYVTSWAAVTALTGVFDGEPREDFEDQWRSNESFAFTWAAVTSATAMFDAGAQSREDFENGWTAATTI